MRNTYLSIILLCCSMASYGQCTIEAFASPQIINCSDEVVLGAQADDGISVFREDFSDGDISDFANTPSGSIRQNPGPCDIPSPNSTHHFWFDGTAASPRFLETPALDVASGGTVCFDMRYSGGQPNNENDVVNCEDPDLPTEGVHLQYNIGGGWQEMAYWDPNGGQDPARIVWDNYCVAIPPAAVSNATRFRWIQEANSTSALGEELDHWGISNIEITVENPAGGYTWQHTGVTLPTGATDAVSPTNTTTYTVSYSNGVETCQTDVEVIVNKPDLRTTANPATICLGDRTQLIADSDFTEVLDLTCSYDPTKTCNPNTRIGAEYQVGNGNTVISGGNNNGNLFGTSNADGATRAQIIYRAQDLINAGFKAGSKIRDIQFDIASHGGDLFCRNLEIRMQCTNSNQFANNGNFLNVNQVVYNNRDVNLAVGWNIFEFDRWFNWDGTSNIIVQVCWHHDAGGQRTNGFVRNHNAGFQAMKTAATNAAGQARDWNCNSDDSFDDEFNTRPNTRFTVCEPRDVDLVYDWTPKDGTLTNDNTFNPLAEPTQNATYTVSVFPQGFPDCAVTSSVDVGVVTGTVTATNTGDYCLGETIQLDADVLDGATYAWTGPNGFTSNIRNPTIPNASAANAGTYNLVVNASGCSSNGSTQVVVHNNAPPANPFASDVCEGATLELLGLPNGMASYEWYGPNSFTANVQNPTRPNVTVDDLGTYSLTITDANGCTSEGTVDVQVSEIDPPTLNSNSPVCLEETLNLQGGPGGMSSYSWTGPNNFTANGMNVTRPDMTVADEGFYVLTIEAANGCTRSDSIEVATKVLPNTIASNDTSICLGECLVLSASGGNTYEWSNGATGPAIPVCPNVTTTYQVTATLNGCTASDEVEVTLFNNPTVDAGADTAICINDNARLFANGAVTYAWSNGSSGASITVNPTATTVYEVTGTDANGCSATDEVEVTVNALPNVDAGADESICLNEQVTLTSSGAENYSWSTGEQTASIDVTPTADITYYVTGTDANSCANVDSVFVEVRPLPNTNAGPDVTICNLDEANLVASGGNSYVWNNGVTTAENTVSPNFTTTYTVVATANNCTAEDEVVVTVNQLPIVDAGNDIDVCDGACDRITATGAIQYSWSNGNNTNSQVVCPTTTTTYEVTGTDNNGCSATDAVEVVVNELPDVSAGDDVQICLGDRTTLLGTGAATYEWSNGPTTANNSVEPAITTIYAVTGTDNNGCTATDAVRVEVIQNLTMTVSNDTSICLEGTANLRANGVGTFTWSNGDAGPSIFVQPTDNTTYTVRMTVGTCFIEDDIFVEVRPIPSPTFSPAAPETCENIETTVTAGGGIAYRWSTGDNAALTRLTPRADSTITVTVTNNRGCSKAASVLVVAHEIPAATIASGMQDHCGLTANIAAVPSVGNGTWSAVGAGGTTVSFNPNNTDANITTTVSDYGSYTYQWKEDNNGCSDSVTGQATFIEVPTADAGPTQSVCVLNATLAAVPSVGVGTWSLNNGPGATNFGNVNSSTSSVDFSDYGQYDLTWTEDNNGCANSDVVRINVFEQPVANAGVSDDICGRQGQLNATVSSGAGVWSQVGGPGVSAFSDNSNERPTVNVTQEGVYTYEWEETNGVCVDAAQMNFEYKLIPTPVITTTDNEICNGDQTSLTATGGISYAWSSGQNVGAINVTPAISTTYTVTVTANNSCTASENQLITVNQNPTITVDPPQSNVCLEQTLQLNGVPVGGSGNYVRFTWSGDNKNLDNPDIQSPQFIATNVAADDAISMNIEVEDDKGCLGDFDHTVFVKGLPTVDAGADIENCITANHTIGDEGMAAGGNGVYTYLWSNAGVLDDATKEEPRVNINEIGEFVFTVTVTDGFGCTVSDDQKVIVNPPPKPQLEDIQACIGETVTLKPLNVKDNEAYFWSNGKEGVFNDVLFFETPTTYSVTAQNTITKCVGEASVTISERILSVDIDVPSNTVQYGDELELSHSGDEGNVYVWGPPEIIAENNLPQTTATITEDVNITLTVFTLEGCEGQAELPVRMELPDKLITVVNAFTPNDDGVNDRFKFVKESLIQIQEVIVVNRWGESVHHYPERSPEQFWNGHYKGKIQPMGDYSYIIKAHNNVTKQPILLHGNVTLLR